MLGGFAQMSAVGVLEPRVVHSQVDSPFGSVPVRFFPSPSAGVHIPTPVLANEGDQVFGTQPEQAVFDWLDDHPR